MADQVMDRVDGNPHTLGDYTSFQSHVDEQVVGVPGSRSRVFSVVASACTRDVEAFPPQIVRR